MRETLGLWLKRIFPLAAILWLIGVLALALDDRYSTEQFVAGAVFPPYALYVGVKETIRLAPSVIEKIQGGAPKDEPPATGDTDQ